jgi:hypothetical protein
MILCEWDAPDGNPGQSCVHLFARILSTSFTSVSIFSVCYYSSVSISMSVPAHSAGAYTGIFFFFSVCYYSSVSISMSVPAHSAGAYTASLLVMVNVVKGGKRAPPPLTSLG